MRLKNLSAVLHTNNFHQPKEKKKPKLGINEKKESIIKTLTTKQ